MEFAYLSAVLELTPKDNAMLVIKLKDIFLRQMDTVESKTALFPTKRDAKFVKEDLLKLQTDALLLNLK